MSHETPLTAGIYLGTGIICLWAGITVRQQDALIYLLAFGVFLAGFGRLVSMRKAGLPQPRAVWPGYLVPELLVPVIMVVAHHGRPSLCGDNRRASCGAPRAAAS